VDVLRQQDEPEFSLQMAPLHKEVFFDTSGRGSIGKCCSVTPCFFSESIFRDMTKLKDYPLENGRRMLVNYGPNGIEFYLPETRSEKKEEFALVSPAPLYRLSLRRY